jgi:hypothetical protein
MNKKMMTVTLYCTVLKPPKAAAQATAHGFKNPEPRPWAVKSRYSGFLRPRLPMAQLGRLQALGLSRHITIFAHSVSTGIACLVSATC